MNVRQNSYSLNPLDNFIYKTKNHQMVDFEIHIKVFYVIF